MADLQETVGQVIRYLRQERGLTLKELARRAALSVVYLGEIERGKKYPSARVLEQVAEALELNAADLLEIVVDELRGTPVAPLRLPVGFRRSDENDARPRNAAAPMMSVMQPGEVATVMMMGTFFFVPSTLINDA